MLCYYERDVPHDVELQSELVSYLVESDSDRVIGIIIHEFVSRAVREYPELADALRWAIIVSGDKIQPASHDASGPTSRRNQAKPWNRVHKWLIRRLAEEGRERMAETVQSLLRSA